ncbi:MULTISPECIES: RidA family protein [unclassified Microbacterium]|uniref:RidA family protein n=1 Tax=unclassified Microbacterium TaxID=2609290 RepID=UPI001AC393C8|nr:RidA family protein [Microbacterium sp.]MBN9157394.1 RidA family protein [Microbacterium sp.]MBS1900041.1 RidA family protein [Actinomycetota bacterium]
MTIASRLAELGIELPSVAAPVAAYVPARVHAGLVYTSGQLPFVAGSLPATGKVGAEVSAEDAQALARTCALNAVAAAADAAGGVDRLGGVLRVGGFVASAPSFSGQPGVINGASEVLGEIFGDAGKHVRAAVGVAVLPLDSPVEVDVVFTLA